MLVFLVANLREERTKTQILKERTVRAALLFNDGASVGLMWTDTAQEERMLGDEWSVAARRWLRLLFAGEEVLSRDARRDHTLASKKALAARIHIRVRDKPAQHLRRIGAQLTHNKLYRNGRTR